MILDLHRSSRGIIGQNADEERVGILPYLKSPIVRVGISKREHVIIVLCFLFLVVQDRVANTKGLAVFRIKPEYPFSDLQGPYRYSSDQLKSLFTEELSPASLCEAMRRHGMTTPLNTWQLLILELLGAAMPKPVHHFALSA